MSIVKFSNVRLFFPALTEANEYKGRKSYNAKLGVDPAGASHKDIEANILEVATAKFNKMAERKIAQFRPVPQQFPYRSGDEMNWEGAEGLMVLTATKKESAGKPLLLSNVRYSGDEFPQSRGQWLRILDGSGKVGVEVKETAADGSVSTRVEPVEVADEITVPYSGCYVNASVEFWAQDGDNSGIRCALRAVQFHRDGDAFAGGGSKVKTDEFDDLATGADADDLPI